MNKGKDAFVIESDPYGFVNRVVFCKWKPFMLKGIAEEGVVNFAKFTKQLPITQKVLTENLKALERDGLISRTVIPEIPPRTEYMITERGRSAVDLLDMIYAWGRQVMIEDGMAIDVVGEMWHGYRKRDFNRMLNRF